MIHGLYQCRGTLKVYYFGLTDPWIIWNMDPGTTFNQLDV